MKAVQRNALKEILMKHLIDFRNEENKDVSVMEHYAEHSVEEFERYLKAYHEFKED